MSELMAMVLYFVFLLAVMYFMYGMVSLEDASVPIASALDRLGLVACRLAWATSHWQWQWRSEVGSDH
jgi:Na+-transporting methylmalonyl-CoA/oxaloacetate decarboxylase gamma subunit